MFLGGTRPPSALLPFNKARKSTQKAPDDRLKNVYQASKISKPRLKTDPGVSPSGGIILTSSSVSPPTPVPPFLGSSAVFGDKSAEKFENLKHRLFVSQRRRSLASGHMPN